MYGSRLRIFSLSLLSIEFVLRISLLLLLSFQGILTCVTIVLLQYAVDHGIVKGASPETIVKIQCPCGLVTAHVEYQDGRAGAVRIDSVPCCVCTDLSINLGKCVCL